MAGSAGGAPLNPPAPPAQPVRDARYRATVDNWFDRLYPLYCAKWHPAIAAIEAHLGAQRRSKPALP